MVYELWFICNVSWFEFARYYFLLGLKHSYYVIILHLVDSGILLCLSIQGNNLRPHDIRSEQWSKIALPESQRKKTVVSMDAIMRFMNPNIEKTNQINPVKWESMNIDLEWNILEVSTLHSFSWAGWVVLSWSGNVLSPIRSKSSTVLGWFDVWYMLLKIYTDSHWQGTSFCGTCSWRHFRFHQSTCVG